MDIGLLLNTEPIRGVGVLEPICVEPQTPVADVLRVMQENRRGSAFVCRNGRLVGIFTERDALKLICPRATAEQAAAAMAQPIESVMTPDPITLRGDESVKAAVARMSENGYRRLPIVDENHRPVGLIDAAVIMRWLVELIPRTVYNLPPVPNPTTSEREGP